MNVSMLCFLEQGSENFAVPWHLEPGYVILDEDDPTHVAHPSLCKHEENLTSLANSFSPSVFVTLSNQSFNDFEIILRLCLIDVVVTVFLPIKEVIQSVLCYIVCSACLQKLINHRSFGLLFIRIFVVLLILDLSQKEFSELWHVKVANCDRFAYERSLEILDTLYKHQFDPLGQHSIGELLVFICQILFLLHKLLIVCVFLLKLHLGQV